MCLVGLVFLGMVRLVVPEQPFGVPMGDFVKHIGQQVEFAEQREFGRGWLAEETTIGWWCIFQGGFIKRSDMTTRLP